MNKKKVLSILVLVFVLMATSLMMGCEAFKSDNNDDNDDDNDVIAYKLYGMNFSPYMEGQNPKYRPFISEGQIRERMKIIAPYTKWIKTFGLQDGLNVCGRVAHELGLKIAVGAWLGTDRSANDKEISDLITVGRAGEADLLVVGSEVLLRNDLSEEELIFYINNVKASVPGVPVTTADVYYELITHPDVSAVCDVIFANFYPYWERIAIEKAMANIHIHHLETSLCIKGKEIFVGEAGWPSNGNQIGDAVPNPVNAAKFFLNFISWARAEKVNYFYFEAFDEGWKIQNEGPQGGFWGIWDKDGKMKPGMTDVFEGKTVPNNWKATEMPGGPGNPAITFTYVPPYGSFDNLQGQVLHVWPEQYRIAVCIYITGWWNKPYFDSPLTYIDIDGRWTCDITTGGIDEQATKIAAFLVPFGYSPPLFGNRPEIPVELIENSVAWVEVTRSPTI